MVEISVKKRSMTPQAFRVPIWKMNFGSKVLRLSKLPRCEYLEWLGRLKCLATGLDAQFSFLFTSPRCSRNRSPSRLPVLLTYNFCNKCKLCSRRHWRRCPWFTLSTQVITSTELSSKYTSTLSISEKILCFLQLASSSFSLG